MRRIVVAGLAQVAQRLDDRQAGADRRLVQVVRTARAPRLVQPRVELQVRAVRLLVRRHDVNAARQPARIAAATSALAVQSMITACGRCSAWMCCAKRARSAGSARLLNASRQRVQLHFRVGEQHALGRHDAAHAQVELEIARQALDLRRQLVEQHAADRHRARSARSRSCAARDRSSHAPSAAPGPCACSSITTEMFRSDAPCAIARTLTAAVASAPNTFAATPGVPAMPSPTTARMLQPGSTCTCWICPSRSSRSNACRTTRLGARRFRFRNREADRMLGAALRDQDRPRCRARAARRTGAAPCRARRSCPRLRG